MFNTKIITRSVWLLSLVSFCTDIASEMLYPIMPIYLKEIGFSIVLIGILEGVAEATAGLSKGYFGKLSDVRGRRLPFVQVGYFFSALSKPMMAVLTLPWWIFFARTVDRLGKGIRTGARDAMLSDATIPAYKGQVFGFHRGMDTLGAAIGPLAALAFLQAYPGAYKPLFYLAFFPGMVGVALTFLLKDKAKPVEQVGKTTGFFSYLGYWGKSPLAYRRLLIGLLAFTLFNSSDVFLLLMLKQQGLSDTNVLMVYIFYNLMYALFSYPIGVVADKIGLKMSFLAGLGLFSLVYAGMAWVENIYGFFFLFFLYGIYAASTEGIAKAWISNIAHKNDTATAIGMYASLQSICTMLASSLAALLWSYISPAAAFLVSATGALLVILYLWKQPEKQSIVNS